MVHVVLELWFLLLLLVDEVVGALGQRAVAVGVEGDLLLVLRDELRVRLAGQNDRSAALEDEG